jgi:hypothetical protein
LAFVGAFIFTLHQKQVAKRVLVPVARSLDLEGCVSSTFVSSDSEVSRPAVRSWSRKTPIERTPPPPKKQSPSLKKRHAEKGLALGIPFVWVSM